MRGQFPIFAAFFLSGFAGLMHEVVWSKQLVQLIGSTAHAQAAVLAVFMGGLALGSVLFGRRVDRRGRPLRTYVILEFLIGGYCLAIPLLLKAASWSYVALAGLVFEVSALKIILRFLLAMAVVLVPAILMGGTLPIIARYLIRRVDQTQRHVGNLYALNSLGAVLGAGVAGFVTLPLVGIYPSLVLAASLNFVAGGVVALFARRETAKARKPMSTEVDGALAYQPAQYLITLVALALSGFAAMGYEVLFLRVIGLAFGSSVFSFTVMLMCFIAGIALGSAIISRWRLARPLLLLGVSQLLAVGFLLASTPLVARLPYLISVLRLEVFGQPYGFELYQLGKAGLCLAVLLLPTVCLGFGFPLVAQVQARRAPEVGYRVGSTYAWNTVGNVLGVIGTALFLLPGLGLLGAFHVNIGLNLAAGFAILCVARETSRVRRIGAVLAALVVSGLYVSLGTTWTESINFAVNHHRLRAPLDPNASPADRARHPGSSFAAWKSRYLRPPANHDPFFFEEDSHNTVLVFGSRSGQVVRIRLAVNGKVDAGIFTRDMKTQLLVAHAPLFLVPGARSVLVIGHGSGITAGSTLLHPSVERLDVVEISRGVLNADRIFEEHNNRVLADPRTRVYEDDAQSFLRTVPRRYDVIISQPSNPWIAGVSGLFTKEFFEVARAKLNPGGVFTFWFHNYEQSDASTALIVRTLEAVFPHLMIFSTHKFNNAIMVASVEPIRPSYEVMERRFRETSIREDLGRMGITNLLSFLTHERITKDATRKLAGRGPLNTVGHQRLEYAAPRSFFLGEYSHIP